MMEEEIRWIVSRFDGDQLVFRIGKWRGELVAEWPSVARIRSSVDGEIVHFEAMPDAHPDMLAKLRNGAAKGLVAQLRGNLALHAGCFEFRGKAVACLGLSGAGKSTAVADACLYGGAHLISDDVLVIDPAAKHPLACATEDSHWLTPMSMQTLLRSGAATLDRSSSGYLDVAEAKSCVHARSKCVSPAPLAAMVWLEFSSAIREPELRPLAAADMMARALSAVVRFALEDQQILAREFDQLCTLVHMVPGLVLSRPPDFGSLHACRERLLSLASRSVVSLEGDG